jgi:glycosyltransferase involved in cell wall biosynthesis
MSAAGLAGEVMVADNGSIDGSALQAFEAGARVVHVAARGYGHAIRGGIAAAQGRDLIIADADGSYELGQIPQMVALLRHGYDLVVGNRWTGTIQPAAMPWKNRYVGNPILSGVGRILYRTNLRDFHCGLRGLRVDAWRRLDLRTGGMEFASEMIIKASMAGLRTAEFPTTLRPRADGSVSHLRPWRDGWRHLSLLIRCRFQFQAQAGTGLTAKPV